MCISETKAPSADTDGHLFEAQQSQRAIRESFQLADQLYKEAVNQRPTALANELLKAAHDLENYEHKRLMRLSALMLLEHEHMLAREIAGRRMP